MSEGKYNLVSWLGVDDSLTTEHFRLLTGGPGAALAQGQLEDYHAAFERYLHRMAKGNQRHQLLIRAHYFFSNRWSSLLSFKRFSVQAWGKLLAFSAGVALLAQLVPRYLASDSSEMDQDIDPEELVFTSLYILLGCLTFLGVGSLLMSLLLRSYRPPGSAPGIPSPTYRQLLDFSVSDEDKEVFLAPLVDEHGWGLAPGLAVSEGRVEKRSFFVRRLQSGVLGPGQRHQSERGGSMVEDAGMALQTREETNLSGNSGVLAASPQVGREMARWHEIKASVRRFPYLQYHHYVSAGGQGLFRVSRQRHNNLYNLRRSGQAGEIAWSVWRSYAHQVFEQLRALHNQGIIWGDLKSDNVLYDASQVGLRCFASDFINVAGDGGSITETPEYLPPDRRDYNLLSADSRLQSVDGGISGELVLPMDDNFYTHDRQKFEFSDHELQLLGRVEADLQRDEGDTGLSVDDHCRVILGYKRAVANLLYHIDQLTGEDLKLVSRWHNAVLHEDVAGLHRVTQVRKPQALPVDEGALDQQKARFGDDYYAFGLLALQLMAPSLNDDSQATVLRALVQECVSQKDATERPDDDWYDGLNTQLQARASSAPSSPARR